MKEEKEEKKEEKRHLTKGPRILPEAGVISFLVQRAAVLVGVGRLSSKHGLGTAIAFLREVLNHLASPSQSGSWSGRLSTS